MINNLLDVEQVAEQLGISQRNVWRMRDAGRMPGAVTLGRLIRWRASDIDAWVGDGCPDVKKTRWTAPVGVGCACKRGAV